MVLKTLEKIEKAIFEASLTTKPDIKELGKMYTLLSQMRCKVLYIMNEKKLAVEEVGGLWFRVTEDFINVRIMIREQKGLDVSQEVEEMKKLLDKWGINEKK